MHHCHRILYFKKQYKIESKNKKKTTTTITKKKWKGPSSRNACKDIKLKKNLDIILSPFPWHRICNDLHVEEAIKAKSLPQLKKNWEHDDWLRRSFSVSKLGWKLTDGISWNEATSKEKWQQTRQVLLLSRLQRKLKEKEKKKTKKIYRLTKSIY